MTEEEAVGAGVRSVLPALGPSGLFDAFVGVIETGEPLMLTAFAYTYASLRHLVAVRPDFVKLGISLVHGIDQNPATRALVAGFVHYARETNCQPIGEGVETEAQRETLVGLGVALGQGYLLWRPVPADG